MTPAAQNTAIMPYSMLVGMGKLKLALELAYISPSIGGVLLSGQRGTGKSTVVRAFGWMVYGRLPVTLPINATEDRVVGGWAVDQLLLAKLKSQSGLLEEADKSILYIDEVNLLDDHIVNIILDVSSTNQLVVEREGKINRKSIYFTLVGTMNPSEGGLRPQLLDRFGLMVDVVGEQDEDVRAEILQAVIDWDAARALQRVGLQGSETEKVAAARRLDRQKARQLKTAQENFSKVVLPKDMARACVKAGQKFGIEGHRGDYVLALAARANAALNGRSQVEAGDVREVASLALQHRRAGAANAGGRLWTAEDISLLEELASDPPAIVGMTGPSDHGEKPLPT